MLPCEKMQSKHLFTGLQNGSTKDHIFDIDTKWMCVNITKSYELIH